MPNNKSILTPPPNTPPSDDRHKSYSSAVKRFHHQLAQLPDNVGDHPQAQLDCSTPMSGCDTDFDFMQPGFLDTGVSLPALPSTPNTSQPTSVPNDDVEGPKAIIESTSTESPRTYHQRRFAEYNRYAYRRGNFKECFGMLAVDGTIIIDNSERRVATTTRTMYEGQHIAFMFPGAKLKYCRIPPTKSRFTGNFCLYNVRTKQALNLPAEKDVHWSSRMQFYAGCSQSCNLCLLDDTRIMVLVNIYHVPVSLSCYLGNWRIMH